MTAPITPDERAAMRETVATLNAAWEVGDPTRPLVDEHTTLALLVQVATQVPRLLDALDTAEAEVEASQRQHNAAFESVKASAREHARAAEAWEAQTYEVLNQRDQARAEVARLREEAAPVRPDRETIERALRDAGLVEVVAVHEGYGAEEVVHSHLRPVVDAVLTAWPGESRATVQAEALRNWISEWPTTPGDGTFLADVARADRLDPKGV